MKFAPSSYVAVYDVSDFALVILIVKPGSDSAYLFTLHKLSGSLDFSGIPQHSIFSNREKAEKFIRQTYKISTPKHVGIALVGYAHTGSKISLIIVTEAIPIAYFLNRHVIFQVKSAKNVTIDIPLFPEDSVLSQKKIAQIENFPLVDLHMWCETKDITSPLGFNVHKDDFVWNNKLAAPFDDYGHRDACITLIQGTACSQVIEIESQPIRFTIITIRSSKHAGTRYHTRGLNQNGYPANEVQCELIIEDSDGDVKSHFWRRGTVPVQWRTVQSKALPTATLEVESNNAVKTPIYFNRLRNEYSNSKIVIANLLHNNESNSEYKLCTAYKNAVSNEKNLSYFEFDWHSNKKELGIGKCVESYWENIFNNIKAPTFTTLKLNKNNKVIHRSNSSNRENNNESFKMFLFDNDSSLGKYAYTIESCQNAFVRVNCMDSLDRTNVGCFFYCIYVIIYYLRRADNIPSYDQLISLEESLRVFLANAFISIGDTVSILYTNTPACMTSTFTKCAGLESKASSDSTISVQRRYQNFYKDNTRQKSIDSFLRVKSERHTDLFCVSTYPATFFPPLPGNISADNQRLYGILSYTPSTFSFNLATNSLQATICLSHTSFLHSLVINIIPPYSPTMVSIEGGLLLSNIHKICSDFALPKITYPAPVILRIPPDYSNGRDNLVRIIRLTFFATDVSNNSNLKITLSNLFIFGSKTPEKPDFILQKNIYTDLQNLPDDEKWPRISDTSSLHTIIENINQSNLLYQFNTSSQLSSNVKITNNLKDITLDIAALVELTRLHHRHTKLETAALLAVNGFDPNDFNFARFKGMLSSNSPNAATNQISTYQSNEQMKKISLTTSPVVKSQIIQNQVGKVCSCCNAQSLTTLHAIDGESFLINGDSAELCTFCFNKFNKLSQALVNVKRFYNKFWTIHEQSETEMTKFYKKYPLFNANINIFPSTCFILCNTPEENLVLTKEGGFIQAPAHFQVALGSKSIVKGVRIYGEKKCVVKIQSVNTSGTVKNKQLTCALNENETSATVSGEIFDQSLNILVTEGILHKLEFNLVPDSFHINTEYETVPWKLNETIIQKKHLVQNDKNIIFKLNKSTTVSGLAFEKMTGINAIIVLFNNSSNSEISNDYDYFYIPLGTNDFILFFQKKRTAQMVKVIFYDTDPTFQLSKLSLF